MKRRTIIILATSPVVVSVAFLIYSSFVTRISLGGIWHIEFDNLLFHRSVATLQLTEES